MFYKKIFALITTICLASVASAETFQIEMLDKGEAGKMIFQPAYLHVRVGDTVTFIPTSKGHNAETIRGMIPDGAEGFKTKISAEVSVTLTSEGIYGIKCTPHYAMGMVALIQVGSAINIEEAKLAKHSAKVKAKMNSLFDEVK
jgi:pseudoazurin